jgi:hypothetical protein
MKQGLVTVCFLLNACTAQPPKDVLALCGVEPASGWVQLSKPPPEVGAHREIRIEDDLKKNSVWFHSGDDKLRFCRYSTPNPKPCDDVPMFEDFQLVNGAWRVIGGTGPGYPCGVPSAPGDLVE